MNNYNSEQPKPYKSPVRVLKEAKAAIQEEEEKGEPMMRL